jgi:hypothetical protein
MIRVENAYEAFAELLEIYNQLKLNQAGISENLLFRLLQALAQNLYRRFCRYWRKQCDWQ